MMTSTRPFLEWTMRAFTLAVRNLLCIVQRQLLDWLVC
jgi:hypothetical protein